MGRDLRVRVLAMAGVLPRGAGWACSSLCEVCQTTLISCRRRGGAVGKNSCVHNMRIFECCSAHTPSQAHSTRTQRRNTMPKAPASGQNLQPLAPPPPGPRLRHPHLSSQGSHALGAPQAAPPGPVLAHFTRPFTWPPPFFGGGTAQAAAAAASHSFTLTLSFWSRLYIRIWILTSRQI